MKDNAYTRFSVISAMITGCLLAVSLILLTAASIMNIKSTKGMRAETAYIFISDEKYSESVSEDRNRGWWIRSYDGRIGIFDESGSLLYVLETYIKTLPKADRDLLGEGIYANDSKELNKLLEAYSD